MTPFNSSFFTKDVTSSCKPIERVQSGGSLVQDLVGKGLYLLVGLALGGLLGCEGDGLMQADWEQYENPRYDFVFPYPDTWIASPVIDDRDGQAFSDPNFEAVKMTGWARQASRPTNGDGATPEGLSLSPNFVTAQGIPGQLEVEIGTDMSVMTLRLSQDGVLYSWEGRSPSGLFDDYYQFFYYVAKNYRIES